MKREESEALDFFHEQQRKTGEERFGRLAEQMEGLLEQREKFAEDRKEGKEGQFEGNGLRDDHLNLILRR